MDFADAVIETFQICKTAQDNCIRKLEEKAASTMALLQKMRSQASLSRLTAVLESQKAEEKADLDSRKEFHGRVA